MKILITGTTGRIGRAIYIKLMQQHQVIGIDRLPCSTVDLIGDIRDDNFIKQALNSVDVIVHTAALHAPHVGLVSDNEFNDINVAATERLFKLGAAQGIKHFVFTSTTALYGKASTPKNTTGWINESVTPQPKTIYHRSKIAAETLLEQLSKQHNIAVTVLQMSRSFPEPADLMALYRLNRGVDPRDVACAHSLAIDKRLPGFRRFIISAATPFERHHCTELFNNPAALVAQLAPDLSAEFSKRGWSLPQKIDRVYDSSAAQQELDWQPKYGFKSVLQMLDDQVSEVLPVIN
ncbi:MAG: NAD(P)-dependent oxidoreductase [Gammaproteobacteria bacterium]|nr:NAD(P)-dependent oxidoreductase [Gammaproteobacteria bacterium]